MPYEPNDDLLILLNDVDTKLRVSRATLAVLSGVPASAISKAANGLDDLPYVKFRGLRMLVDDLLELQRRAGDIRIDWSDFRASRRLLDALAQERSNPPADPQPEDWYITAAAVSREAAENIASRFGIPLEEVPERIRIAVERIDRKIETLQRHS
jgi:hypothetical protein